MAEDQWFILIGQERQGPLSAHDVRYLLTRRNIDGGTLIWREGMKSWVRLREVEEFHPKKKDEAETEPVAAPPPAPEPAGKTRLLQRLIPALLSLGLVGGAIYVFVTDDTPDDTPQRRSTTTQRRQRTPQDLVDGLKRGERGAKSEIIRAGNRAVPALIQALMEKGSPLNPREVKAILIEIGPSSVSAIRDALEELDLSNTSQIILVEILGEFGGLTSVPALIVALGNPNPEVQERAIEAIAKLNPDFGPALARHLTSPIEPLSKQQKVNLATALGQHRSPKSIPAMQKAQKAERDRDVIAALAKAVEQISRNPRTSDPVPPVVIQTGQGGDRKEGSSNTPPPQNISVSVSATATATATAESEDKEEDEEEEVPPEPSEDNAAQAEKLAEEGRKLREAGNEEAALEKYRQAYALHPIRAYLIIILALEGNPDSPAAASADTTSETPLPEIEAPVEVSLAEIYDEMGRPDPDLGSYSGGLGSWSGTIENVTPFSRDGRRDLFIVRGGSGQDFIAAVRRREIEPSDVGSQRTWRGTLQGFRVTEVDGESRMLPVLSVE